ELLAGASENLDSGSRYTGLECQLAEPGGHPTDRPLRGGPLGAEATQGVVELHHSGYGQHGRPASKRHRTGQSAKYRDAPTEPVRHILEGAQRIGQLVQSGNGQTAARGVHKRFRQGSPKVTERRLDVVHSATE